MTTKAAPPEAAPVPDDHTPEQILADHAVVLFDGVCNLCNSSVNFLIDRDPAGYFKFAALQSDEAVPFLMAFAIPEDYLDSIILLEGKRWYGHSDAPLQIARKMPGAWPLLYGFKVFPRFLRDAVYNGIARNRYRWFGKRDTCRIPTPDLRARFL